MGGRPHLPLLPAAGAGGLRGRQGLAQPPLLPVAQTADRQAATD